MAPCLTSGWVVEMCMRSSYSITAD